MKTREEFINELGLDASMIEDIGAIKSSEGINVEDMRSRVNSVKVKKNKQGLPIGMKREENPNDIDEQTHVGKGKRLSTKAHAFAMNVASGMSPREAYRRAYNPPNSSDATMQKNANALLKDARITLLLESLWEDVKENIITDQVIARRFVIKELLAHAKDEKNQTSNKLKALELMGRAIGMFTDKVEQRVEEISVEQLKKELESSLHLLENKRASKHH
jgi:chorismate mutase